MLSEWREPPGSYGLTLWLAPFLIFITLPSTTYCMPSGGGGIGSSSSSLDSEEFVLFFSPDFDFPPDFGFDLSSDLDFDFSPDFSFDFSPAFSPDFSPPL